MQHISEFFKYPGVSTLDGDIKTGQSFFTPQLEFGSGLKCKLAVSQWGGVIAPYIQLVGLLHLDSCANVYFMAFKKKII